MKERTITLTETELQQLLSRIYKLYRQADDNDSPSQRRYYDGAATAYIGSWRLLLGEIAKYDKRMAERLHQKRTQLIKETT